MLVLLSACMPKVEETKVNLVPRTQGGSTQLVGRWSNANLTTPLNLDISTSFDGEFVGADMDADGHNPIVQAMKSWNNAHPTVNFFAIPGNTIANKDNSDLSTYRDGTLGIYRSDGWFTGISSGTIAITQFYGYIRNSGTSSAYIDLTHADIIVNYRDHNFSTAPNSFEFDIQTVILHELGHFIGLKPPDDYFIPAVMQSTLAQGEQKRTLLAYDTNSLITNYNGYSPNLTIQAAAKARADQRDDDQEVRGIFELKANGECYHFLNDKFVEAH